MFTISWTAIHKVCKTMLYAGSIAFIEQCAKEIGKEISKTTCRSIKCKVQEESAE